MLKKSEEKKAIKQDERRRKLDRRSLKGLNYREIEGKQEDQK